MDSRSLFSLFIRCCPGFEAHWRSSRNLANGQEGDPHALCLEFCSFYIDYAATRAPEGARELFATVEGVIASDPNDKDDVANALCKCFLEPLIGFPAAERSREFFGPTTLEYFTEEEARRNGNVSEP